jgi:hypothetical protein
MSSGSALWESQEDVIFEKENWSMLVALSYGILTILILYVVSYEVVSPKP